MITFSSRKLHLQHKNLSQDHQQNMTLSQHPQQKVVMMECLVQVTPQLKSTVIMMNYSDNDD